MATVIQTGSEKAVYERGMSTIATALAASDWRPLPWVYELITTHATRDTARLGYALHVSKTTMHSTADRHRAGGQPNVESVVMVRVLHPLRADAIVADYATALLADFVTRYGLVGAADGKQDFQGAQHWRWVSSERRAVADGTYLLIEQTYAVRHLLAIF